MFSGLFYYLKCNLIIIFSFFFLNNLGKFMNEIVRRIMIELVKQKLLFNGKLTSQLADDHCSILRTRNVQEIDG